MPDIEWYSEQIAPRLAGLSLTEIARALGVSTSSASKFRRGLRVPASRHWTALTSLVDDLRRPLLPN
jgi:transcriptional regulator with XRE-family HTH domain